MKAVGDGFILATAGVGAEIGVPAIIAGNGLMVAGAGLSGLGAGILNNSSKLKDLKYSNIMEKKGTNSTIEYKNPKSGISGKEGAKNAPSWAKGERPYKNESGRDFAKRLLDEKYGKGNYRKGPKSEYNKIKKWGDRAWE